jgi:hypothetical protein
MLDRSTSSRSHVDIDMVLAELVEDSERIVDEITGLAVILPQDTVENGVRITVISTAGAKVTVRTQGYGGMLLPAIEVVTENPRLLFEAQEGFFLPGLGRMPLSGTGKLARLGHDYQPVYVVQGNPTREVLDCIFRELAKRPWSSSSRDYRWTGSGNRADGGRCVVPDQRCSKYRLITSSLRRELLHWYHTSIRTKS